MDHELLAYISYSLCYVSGVYGGMKFRIFIDTGAQISVISSSLVPILQLQSKINTNFAGSAHGVGRSNILGKIIGLEVKMSDMLITNNYAILESPDNFFLLGMDFLTHHDCEINIKHKFIMIDGYRMNFLNEKEIDELKVPTHIKNTNIIEKIIKNIIDHPKEDKYKKINRKMLNNDEEQFLLCLGFSEANEKLIFNNDITLLKEAIM